MGKPVITVIGAGMGGTLVSILLAKQGYKVELFESRDDIRKIPPRSDRSINQSLSIRGVSVLEKAGLWTHLKKITLKEKGRTVHPMDGEKFFSPYGRNDREIQHSFNRNSFNGALLDFAAAQKRVAVFFNMQSVAIDTANRLVTFINTKDSKKVVKRVEFLIDASGINSVIRQTLEKNSKTVTERKLLNWGYKSLYVPATYEALKRLTSETFHIWPREDSSLFAIPNMDGSFVFTIILPNKKFSSFRNDEEIARFFEANFPDVADLAPVFLDNFKNNKLGRFECLYTSRWYDDFIVMLGDASHAIMPFYSQGASATFEDCQVLVDCITRNPESLIRAFSEYQQLRKINTDVLTDLSHKRFYELKNGFRSKKFLAQNKFETFLSKYIPVYVPLYTLIAHTTIPYAKAYRRYKIQRTITRLLGIDIPILIYANLPKPKAPVLKTLQSEYA